jgi:hypothetical protein
LHYGAWPMFIKRNCVWLIAATFVASNLSQAQAGGGGFLKEAEQGGQYLNDAKQVENTATTLHKDAEGFFKKKAPADAATATTDATKTDAKAMDVKTTEVKTSDASTATTDSSAVKSTTSTDTTTTSK